MLTKLVKIRYLLLTSLVIAVLAFVIFIFTPPTVNELGSAGAVRIYFADNISAAHQEVIDSFNVAFAGQIEVVPLTLPFEKFSTNERKQLLTRTLRSKSSRIDVFAVDVVWVSRFAKWAEPLGAFISQEERGRFLEYALEACYKDTDLVALPFYLDVGVLYYRRDLLAALPDFAGIEAKLRQSMTWEEFLRLKNNIALAGRPFYLFPADSYEGLVCCFVESVNGQGVDLVHADTLSINTGPAAKGLQLLVDLVNKYHVTPRSVLAYREGDVYLEALEKDALFFRGWPGNLEAYKDRYAEKIRNIGVAALPHFSGGKPAAVFGGWNLMISRESAHKQEALRFIKFATDLAMQKRIYEIMGYLPANRKVYQDIAFAKAHPEISYMRHLFDMGVHRPMLDEYTRFSDIISFYIQKAIGQEMSVRGALDRAQRMIRSRKVLIN